MPLLDTEDKTPLETQPLRVRRDDWAMVKAYAKLIDSSESHVLIAAFKRLAEKDADFRAFWAEHQADFLLLENGTAKRGRPAKTAPATA